MRRELKDYSFRCSYASLLGFSSCPDEEGTESRMRGMFPSATSSFSSCPDEEGTERVAEGETFIIEDVVSAVVPMRRELKVLEFIKTFWREVRFQQLSR